MKMLIIEYPDGTADCEPYVPMPGQDALIIELKTDIVDSELLALSYIDRPIDLAIDNEAIKKKVVRALELSNWVQRDAAKLLRIRPKAIWDRIKKYNIVHPEGKWFQGGGRKPRLELKRRQA